MKLLYVFKERAPIFIELTWRISLSSASRLLAATILAGALAGSAMAQAPDAGCVLPSEPKGIPAAIDAAITGPADKDRACMKALLIPEARYGNIAHLWSSYALYSDGKQVARGINSIQAIKEAGGW